MKKNIITGSPYLLLILAVLFWSGNFIVGRAVRADIPPIALAFYRWVLATLLVSVFAVRHVRNDWPVIKEKKGILFFLSVTGIASFNTLVYLGLQRTVAINAFLLQSMIPVIIVSLCFFIYREKLQFIQMTGIFVSLLGVTVIICKGDLDLLLQLSLNKGDLFVFIAVVSYGLYSVGLRKRPSIHPMSFIFVTFLVGLICLIPLYLYEHLLIAQISFNGPTLLAISYVGVFPSIMSYLCYNRGVELVGPAKAGMFIHLMPVFGSIMAIIFLSEKMHPFHVAGFCCIATGIYLTTSFGKR